MKLLTYLAEGKDAVGVLSRDEKYIIPIKELGYHYDTMQELIEGMSKDDLKNLTAKASACEEGVLLESATLDAPIPYPKHDLMCIGRNYAEHVKEGDRFRKQEFKLPEAPIYFSKRVNRAVPPNGFIEAHSDITEKLDYEGELGVVIGKQCRNLKPEEVYDAIFGYTIVNDISARDIQVKHVQFYFGKGLDGFTPIGPYIVTADEFQTPPDLTIRTYVNGELRQESNTSMFLFDIPYTLSQLSSGITLFPGDIYSTGTPSGVGLGFDPPKFLKQGDVIEIEIEGIGRLKNTVK